MIEQYFSPQRVDTFRPVFRAIADDLITAAVSSGTVEVMNHLARRFASRVQCAFLGWPSEMEQPLIEWTLENSRASHDGNREKLNELAKRFQAIVDRQLDLRSQTSGQPAQDITAELMRERVHNRPLSHEEISSILRNWTVGEIGTISASIGILMHHLAVHPDDQVALRSETELLPQAIDEILRVHNPLFSNRRVTRCPVELGPYKLKAGERVTLHWIAANRDEAVFPKADEVQFDRDATRNLLYGAGVHVCPGAPLARMELREFMASLLAQTSSWQLSKEFIPVYASMPESGFCELQVVLLA
jgi:cytochrome P450